MSGVTGLNTVIVGLGLMGGVYADAFRKQNAARISAFDKNEEVLEHALSIGAIDHGTAEPCELSTLLAEADLTVVCLYPGDAVRFFDQHMQDFKPGALITDITGIKAPLMKAVAPILREDVFFIPGHPMAGSEKEGFGGADSGIFVNRNYILVPFSNTNADALARLEDMIYSMGFANIVHTSPEEHDRKIAFTSQLCHVIASALVHSENDLLITDFEGGSFGDLTRIAMINAPMWTELFIDNREALLTQIDKFTQSMALIREDIEKQDDKHLEALLTNVRHKRVSMEIERQNKLKGKK